MGSSQSSPKPKSPSGSYSSPQSSAYDTIDKIAAELPHVIDDESRQQVEDYKQACDDGKGPMVACFSTAEYLSLFERKHREAAELYRNVCFRPSTDRSPNRVKIDGTMAYPPGCYNLAKMHMTGKGGIAVDREGAYQMLDRACRAEHGGACYLQAQVLCTEPGALDAKLPHDPQKALQLYQANCTKFGDSISCYTAATMLLRGDKVHKRADNVSPQEAQGQASIAQRENEDDRRRTQDDYVIRRNPAKARDLLEQACNSGNHVTSCHNLAVMYTHGDEGVPADPDKAEEYKRKTQKGIDVFGGF